MFILIRITIRNLLKALGSPVEIKQIKESRRSNDLSQGFLLWDWKHTIMSYADEVILYLLAVKPCSEIFRFNFCLLRFYVVESNNLRLSFKPTERSMITCIIWVTSYYRSQILLEGSHKMCSSCFACNLTNNATQRID